MTEFHIQQEATYPNMEGVQLFETFRNNTTYINECKANYFPFNAQQNTNCTCIFGGLDN